MNNKNKDFFISDVDVNVGEEEITLAPHTELIEEAKKIAQNTKSDEKFPFALQYNANQKEFLLSMIKTAGAIVEDDDEEGHVLATMMNMTQLAFIKQLDCVERVKTDEGTNPFLIEEAVDPTQIQQEDESIGGKTQEAATNIDSRTLKAQFVELAEIDQGSEGVAVASVAASTTSTSNNCPTNTDWDSAQDITTETLVKGCICCQGAEQWFKFTVPETKEYTIYTTGSLDTEGELYDHNHNRIDNETTNIKIDGRLNLRIRCILYVGVTYYICVSDAKNNTGSYTLKVTKKVLADYVTVNKSTISLEKGVTYELPITPNYTYKGYNGAKPIPGLSVSINPSNADEQRIWWQGEFCGMLDVVCDFDDDGDLYMHVTATEIGSAKLYASDWNQNAKRDECIVNVDNMLIYRTRNRERLGFYDSSNNEDITPITAEDLTYGKKDTRTITSNGTKISNVDLTSYNSISQRVTIIKNFFNSQIGYDETFMEILSEMVDHFVDGTGTDYSNGALTSAVQSHPRTTSYVNSVIALVKNYISKNKTTVGNLAYNENLWTQPINRAYHPLVNAMNTAINNGATELYLPSYGFDNGVPGLTLAIDGFYGNKIRLKDFRNTGNTYSGNLEFTFYDHFGLDTSDLADTKYGNMTAGMLPGFRQWYILQHWSDLEGTTQPKPFVTNVSFSVSFSGTYE